MNREQLNNHDYRKCSKCSARLYHEADIDYGGASIVALCPRCAKDYQPVLIPSELLDEPALQFLQGEIKDLEQQLAQRKEEYHFHHDAMLKAKEGVSRTKDELQKTHNRYNDLVIKTRGRNTK